MIDERFDITTWEGIGKAAGDLFTKAVAQDMGPGAIKAAADVLKVAVAARKGADGFHVPVTVPDAGTPASPTEPEERPRGAAGPFNAFRVVK